MLVEVQHEKVALITGAAGGIGGALVSEFAASGYTVIATDNAEMAVGSKFHHFIKADFTQYVLDELYAKEVDRQFNALCRGKLDVLVNNAAIQIVRPVESLTRDDFGRTFNVNVLAPFFLTQALLSPLEACAGSVVNISSVHARLTKGGFASYATSKAALSGLTRSMAVELGRRVRINAIEAAAIDTKMLQDGFSEKPLAYESLKGHHPVGRIGTPDEIAKLTLWLCSHKCDFINGSCITVDGGISSVLHDPI